jgi:oligopeptide/dipeptide ABC transporter ATP-binding protein
MSLGVLDSTGQAITEPLLQVDDLRVEFRLEAGILKAVDGVSFSVRSGRVLCVVGESGCGKSVTARALLRLIDSPGRIVGGSVRYRGREILKLSNREMESLRGDRISLVFQNAMTSLNPSFPVGEQVAEGLRLHQGLDRNAARERAVALLSEVGIPDAARRYDDFPHQFSGGMRQRILIAGAIACRPDILIADEPTTALDVSIQAQILKLLKALQNELDNALLIITHDLGVVASIADDGIVMYAGKIVEQAPVEALFDRPGHPYTQGLLAASGQNSLSERGQIFAPIPGQPPVLIDLPPGCHFRERCRHAIARCATTTPSPVSVAIGHLVACHLAGSDALLAAAALAS